MKGRTSAAFFAFSSVAAGGLHYLFQLWTADQLDMVDFGELNSWIAYFSVALSLGAFVQYGANFFAASASRLRVASWAALVLSVGALGVALSWREASAIGVGVVGVSLGICFSWLTGQAQVRLAFVVMGVATLITGMAKFALAGMRFPVDKPSVEMAWAVALSYAPALLWLAVSFIVFSRHWPPVARQRGIGQGLNATLVLAIASVFVPQMDIIVIHRTQAAQVIGEFARISLLYKAVFFGFMILAQWLLPHQLNAAVSAPKLVRFLGASRWRVLGVSLLMGAMAILGGLTVGLWLNPALKNQILWIGLSCLNMVFLTNLFFAIQIGCVREDVRRPTIILVALAIEAIGAILLTPSVTRYLLAVTILNALLWLALTAPAPGQKGGDHFF